MTEQAPKPRPARMPPEERKRELLEKAISFFSEEGFDGGTRVLARQIGITQPLIYRYFPSKEDLINEVYHEVYLSQWRDAWAEGLTDRSRPLTERLLDFYESYTAIFDRAWLRIFFFAALKGLDIHTRYLNLVIDRLLVPVCLEMRAELGVESAMPVTEAELDLVWMMHGSVFYQGIREHIYQLPRTIDRERSYRLAVATYVALTREMLPAVVAAAEAEKDAGREVAFDALARLQLPL